MAFVLQDGEWLAFTPLKWEGGKLLSIEFQSLADITSYVLSTRHSVQLSPNETNEFDMAFYDAMDPVRERLRYERARAMESVRDVILR